MTAITSLLRIYPIKSLGFVDLQEATVGTHSLQHDRQFAMVDADGRYVNGKRDNRVNLLKTSFDFANERVSFSTGTDTDKVDFELREENTLLDDYLSIFFNLCLDSWPHLHALIKLLRLSHRL